MPRKPADPNDVRSGTPYKKKFRDENYDRIEINVEKGKKAEYLAAAEKAGLKMAPFIVAAIEEKIKREGLDR